MTATPPSATLPSLWIRFAWYVAAGVVLVLLPVLKYSEWWWRLPRGQKPALLIACIAFGAAALATLALEREQSWSAVVRTFVRSLAVLGLILAAVLLLGRDLPRYLLLGLFVCTFVVIPLSVSPLGRSRLAPLALGLVAVLAAGLAMYRMSSKHDETQATRTTYLKSAFYNLQVVSHAGLIPSPETRGGGLDRIGDRVLLGTGDGSLYLLDLKGDAKPIVEKLATRVPNNREEFAKAYGGSSRQPTISAEFRETGPPRVQTWRFRVADVIARSVDGHIQLFASHHNFEAANECFNVQVSMLDVPAADFPKNLQQASWRTLYESKPCIAMGGTERKRGKSPFKGEEIGGRLALLDARTLLLTLGDHGFSGTESLQAFAQDPKAAYGKTIRIDIASGEAATFTMGHRNPQGLYITPEGRIWETEHGTQGGDELNVLESGQNYGWPNVTYGTDYGSLVWPVSQAQGRHDGYRQPRYSWLPSIGASQVIRIERDSLFPIWTGNLFVGSLSTQSLYRLVADDDRIVLSEPLELGKRVRDILELNDGRLLVWTDDAAILTIEPAKGNAGELVFATQCSGCHAIVDGMSHRLGPDLHGVLTRKPGAASGYDEYTAAMRAQQGEWTRERLDRFLTDPQETVPGNGMAYAGLADAQQRKALIDYLEQASRR